MYFDEVAEKWDTKRRIERANILANSISDKINKKKDLIALEVGCGTGLITLNLINKFSEIYCVDTSKEMVSVFKSKIEKLNITNIYPRGIELINDNNFYGKFDVIYSSMVFHHIIDIKNELRKLYKLFNKEGYLIIIDLDEEDGSFHKDEKDFCGHNGFKRQYLKDILEECNFKEITFETVYEGEKELDDCSKEYSLFLCLAKV